MLAAGTDWPIPPWLVATVFVAVMALVAATQAGWIKLFGPVLFYEVVRSSRRSRYFLFRVLYALGLFLLLSWIYLTWHDRYYGRPVVPAKEMVRLGESFFGAFCWVQYLLIVFLTPAFVAGCIADDKERRVLEFLLATDLANREIVFGKLVARVGNLVMLLLAATPVLSIVQFFGGVDPTVLLLVTGATLMTMLGLVGVSIVNSVQRKRGRDAIIATYGVVIAYLATSQFLWLGIEWMKYSGGGWLSAWLPVIQGVVEPFRWGDPFHAGYQMAQISYQSSRHGEAYLALFWRFAAFHGAVFVLGVVYAVWRVRSIALAQASAGERVGRSKAEHAERTVSDRPMLWKETVAEGKIRVGGLLRLTVGLLSTAGFLPVLFILINDRYGRFSDDINGWLRFYNSVLMCMALLLIAVRAAVTVGSERDRDTLVSLLTTPLTAQEIMQGKFWGAICCVRILGIWLAAAWLIALLLGAVNPLMIPVQLVAMAPPMMAAAAFGLFCSVSCSTTTRALLGTIMGTVFGFGGHWIVTGMCCLGPMSCAGSGSAVIPIVSFMVGLTPPAVFGFVPMHTEHFRHFRGEEVGYTVIGGIGHLMWFVVAAIFYNMAVDKFARSTLRAGVNRPTATQLLIK